MSNNELEASTRGREWHFANFVFEESSRTLLLDGRAVEIESKPLDVLLQLLLHAGEVLTKDELLTAVWPGVIVVEGSLTTAVSKLRKALGDEDQKLIVTAPRIGYRIGVPVKARIVYGPGPRALGFEEGATVPGREQWRLTRRLDASESSEVWLAEHPKTHEQRVFKFAADGIRLRGIKREVTLSRILREGLGERPCFVRVLEWNFDTPPFYLESEYGGDNLLQWAERQGGLPAIPLEERLRVLMEVARAVKSAHDVGVLHKDLKPANILITQEGEVRVADFGSGALSDPGRLESLGITGLGMTRTSDGGAFTGTLLYLAPEVLGGQVPTVQADVYSLGVILYQLVIGDFRRPLSAGWEAGIDDPLLVEDIAGAADGDPQRRLSHVAALVDRLERLEERRIGRRALQDAQTRAAVAEKRWAAARARRPWVIAAAAVLIAGSISSLLLYRTASQQRVIATEMNAFLASDLLGRSNPFQSGKSAESLADAIQAALPDIDRKFQNSPDVAARLHHAVARALDGRTEYAAARKEYIRATELFAGQDGNAAVVQLQRAAMEARTYGEGSLALAKRLLNEQEQKISGLRDAPEDLGVWLASARGMIALIANDGKTASEQFQQAYEQSGSLSGFDAMARLTLKQRWAFAQIRMGNGPRAEQLFRELIDEFSRMRGPDDPNVLRVRLNLAQAYMIQNKHKDAVAETTAIYPAYVERLGPDHELSMQVLTTRAQSEGSLGMWEEAIRDDLKIHEMAVRKQGPLSFFAIATLSDAALAECRADRTAEGLSHAARAYESSLRAFGPRAGLTGGVGYALAVCLIGRNRLDQASALLEQIDRPAVAALAGSQDWPANVDLSLAEIAFRKGDAAAARKYLAAAGPVLKKPDAEAYQRSAVEKLETALRDK